MHLLNTGQNKDAEYFITENDFNCKKTPFEEISLQELNKCLQKFFLSARKIYGRCRSVIVRQNCKSLATVNELKIIIFMVNYLTVLVYIKTINHGRGGG